MEEIEKVAAIKMKMNISANQCHYASILVYMQLMSAKDTLTQI